MEEEYLNSLMMECTPTPQYIQLQREESPVFIWGTGALAVNVFEYCKNYQIKLEGCFVNVPVSTKVFMGLTVKSLEEVAAQYPEFSVIIGHSNYAQGIAFLNAIKNVKHIYCITSCCYGIWNIITNDFLHNNAVTLEKFFRDLQDEHSKKCLMSYFQSRIKDNPEYMFSLYNGETTYFKNDVIHLSNDVVLFDIGACKGSAIWSFIDTVKENYCRIIALEPEDENYVFLAESINRHSAKKITLIKACAYNRSGSVNFVGNDELGGIDETAEQSTTYPAVTIDALCSELEVPSDNVLIKINFPFSVPEILQGAQGLLKERRPQLIIRAGFDENVLLDVYREIKRINPSYKIYLRYTLGIPQGLTLFAI